MFTKINNETYEVSTNLGTAYELEKKFSKKIQEIASGVNDFDIRESISVLYVGFKRKNSTITEKAFEELFMEGEDWGIIDLKKELIIFLTLMMSKNRSESEVREEIENKFSKSIEEAESGEEEAKN